MLLPLESHSCLSRWQSRRNRFESIIVRHHLCGNSGDLHVQVGQCFLYLCPELPLLIHVVIPLEYRKIDSKIRYFVIPRRLLRSDKSYLVPVSSGCQQTGILLEYEIASCDSCCLIAAIAIPRSGKCLLGKLQQCRNIAGYLHYRELLRQIFSGDIGVRWKTNVDQHFSKRGLLCSLRLNGLCGVSSPNWSEPTARL